MSFGLNISVGTSFIRSWDETPVAVALLFLVITAFTEPVTSIRLETCANSGENSTWYSMLLPEPVWVTVARFGDKVGMSFNTCWTKEAGEPDGIKADWTPLKLRINGVPRTAGAISTDCTTPFLFLLFGVGMDSVAML